MKTILFWTSVIILAVAFTCPAQTRRPSTATMPFVVKTNQQIDEIQNALQKQSGNKVEDIVPQPGLQTRVAIFHDEKRVDDLVELHDGSDDFYYVLDGTATLMLGGSLDNAKEVSPGEWKSKTATGGTKIEIKKGDLIFVPRGTPHQRTVTGKGFSMILVKIFADRQPVK